MTPKTIHVRDQRSDTPQSKDRQSLNMSVSESNTRSSIRPIVYLVSWFLYSFFNSADPNQPFNFDAARAGRTLERGARLEHADADLSARRVARRRFPARRGAGKPRVVGRGKPQRVVLVFVAFVGRKESKTLHSAELVSLIEKVPNHTPSSSQQSMGGRLNIFGSVVRNWGVLRRVPQFAPRPMWSMAGSRIIPPTPKTVPPKPVYRSCERFACHVLCVVRLNQPRYHPTVTG